MLSTGQEFSDLSRLRVDHDTPIPVYRQDPDHRLPNRFVTDDAYAQAVQAMTIVCCDTVIIDTGAGVFYLTTRRHLPMRGRWIVGGRKRAGEPPRLGAQRTFQRETGLNLDPGRFEYLRVQTYHWSEREQPPQSCGSENECHTFAIVLTPGERDQAARGLDPAEYDVTQGLQPFDRERMVQEGVHQGIIDLYDLVFPRV